MYLHLGQDVVVPKDAVIGIFDIDNATNSAVTREFLSRAEKNGVIVNIADDIPKSFIVCCESGRTTIYLSQLASATLLRRSESNRLDA